MQKIAVHVRAEHIDGASADGEYSRAAGDDQRTFSRSGRKKGGAQSGKAPAGNKNVVCGPGVHGIGSVDVERGAVKAARQFGFPQFIAPEDRADAVPAFFLELAQ